MSDGTNQAAEGKKLLECLVSSRGVAICCERKVVVVRMSGLQQRCRNMS